MTQGFKTGGRQKGTLNKRSTDVLTIAASILDTPEYHQSLLVRVQQHTLPPALEVLLWHYRYGKPKDDRRDERVDVSELLKAVLLELADRAQARDVTPAAAWAPVPPGERVPPWTPCGLAGPAEGGGGVNWWLSPLRPFVERQIRLLQQVCETLTARALAGQRDDLDSLFLAQGHLEHWLQYLSPLAGEALESHLDAPAPLAGMRPAPPLAHEDELFTRAREAMAQQAVAG